MGKISNRNFKQMTVIHKFYSEKRELLILTRLKTLSIVPIEVQESTVAQKF
jgi:hypothetical protein